jgi:hypothetical protein
VVLAVMLITVVIVHAARGAREAKSHGVSFAVEPLNRFGTAMTYRGPITLAPRMRARARRGCHPRPEGGAAGVYREAAGRDGGGSGGARRRRGAVRKPCVVGFMQRSSIANRIAGKITRAAAYQDYRGVTRS